MKKDWKIRRNDDLEILGIDPQHCSINAIPKAYFKLAKNLCHNSDTLDGGFGKNEERFKKLVRTYERLQHDAYGEQLDDEDECDLEGYPDWDPNQDGSCLSDNWYHGYHEEEEEESGGDRTTGARVAFGYCDADDANASRADPCPGYDGGDNFYDLHRDFFVKGKNDTTYQDFHNVFERRMYYARCRHYFKLMGVTSAVSLLGGGQPWPMQSERARRSYLDRCEERARDDEVLAWDCLGEAREKLELARQQVLEVEGRIVGLRAAFDYAQNCRPHLSEGKRDDVGPECTKSPTKKRGATNPHDGGDDTYEGPSTKRQHMVTNNNLCNGKGNDDACDDGNRDDGTTRTMPPASTSSRRTTTVIDGISTTTTGHALGGLPSIVTPTRAQKETIYGQGRRRFTLDEKRAVVEGVRRFGRNWTTILSEYHTVLSSRTNVNIKVSLLGVCEVLGCRRSII